MGFVSVEFWLFRQWNVGSASQTKAKGLRSNCPGLAVIRFGECLPTPLLFFEGCSPVLYRPQLSGVLHLWEKDAGGRESHDQKLLLQQ